MIEIARLPDDTKFFFGIGLERANDFVGRLTFRKSRDKMNVIGHHDGIGWIQETACLIERQCAENTDCNIPCQRPHSADVFAFDAIGRPIDADRQKEIRPSRVV